MGRLVVAAAAIMAAVALAAGPLAAGELGKDGWERVDAPMPAFSLKDQAGRVLDSDDLAGRVLMIDFWATWCAPCLKELPGLAAWHDRLQDQERIQLLSFNVMDEAEQLGRFAEKHQIHFPIYGADELVEPLEIVAFPTKLIVDMRGEPRIVYRRAGYAPAEEVEPKVAEVVAAGR